MGGCSPSVTEGGGWLTRQTTTSKNTYVRSSAIGRQTFQDFAKLCKSSQDTTII